MYKINLLQAHALLNHYKETGETIMRIELDALISQANRGIDLGSTMVALPEGSMVKHESDMAQDYTDLLERQIIDGNFDDEEYEVELHQIAEGTLGLGTLLIQYKDGSCMIVQERFLNEWSSDHVMTWHPEIPEEYKDKID